MSPSIGIGGDQTDDSSPSFGAAYVFTRAGGIWTQLAHVEASNTGAGDEFGVPLALWADGSTLAVGASDEDPSARGVGGANNDSAPSSGAVYVC